MSERRKETFEREDSPIINVCDTTTAIAVTSESMDHNKALSNHIPLPSTFNFHLNVPYLHQSVSSIAQLSTTANPSDKLLTGRNLDYPSNAESHMKSRTGNVPGIQEYRELRFDYSRNERKTKSDYLKHHHKSKRQSETELRRMIHSFHEQDGSSSDEDEQPDRKMRRCLVDDRTVTQDGCEKPPEESVSFEMTTTRSKVPEEVRLKINSRERQRMHDLNSALDSLRQVMPYSSGPAVKKLSKMSTLLLARNYIVMLTKSVEEMKRLVQELSANQRLPRQVPFPTILHETSISPPVLTASTSGLGMTTPYLHSATAMHCSLTSSLCTTCTCLHCLKKRQSANAAAVLMGWKPG